MRLPGFTGEFSIQGRLQILHHAQELASCRGRDASMKLAQRAVTVALRDSNQECLAECRREGGGSNCAELCRRGPKLGGSSTAPRSDSIQCTIEAFTHPIGALAFDAAIRILKGNGEITRKDQCYTAIKSPAALAEKVAGKLAGDGIFGAILSAAVGFNIETLGKCICDRYF